MTGTQRLYRLTHNTLTKLHPPPPKALSNPHSLINLESLTRFAAGILLLEQETVLLPSDDLTPKLTSKEVTKKCNLPEWEAKLSGRKHPLNSSNDQEQEKVKELPPLPTSRAGVIYASTTSVTTDHDQESNTDNRTNTTSTSSPPSEGEEGEKITSILFAHYEPTINELQSRLKTDLLPPPPKPSGHSLFSEEDPDALTSVLSRIQHLIEQRGVTRIWICGTDPGYRRHHQMATNLRLLEQEVLQWKKRETRKGSEKQEGRKEEEKGCVSGVVTAHTVPLRFPGMVQFLLKSGFKGGDRIKTSEDKVFYWKEIK